MKSFVCALVIFLISNNLAIQLSSGDDSISLNDFENAGILPHQHNGTVSEHIKFMASIRLKSDESKNKFGYGHFCGGVFISRKHILTVASCLKRVETLDPNDLLIIAGTRYRYDSTEADILEASQIKLHPNYAIKSLPNNVAIITVSLICFLTAFRQLN